MTAPNRQGGEAGVADSLPQPGTKYAFANGGCVNVHWVDDNWIGFATSHPDWPNDTLSKMEHWRFLVAIQHTGELHGAPNQSGRDGDG